MSLDDPVGKLGLCCCRVEVDVVCLTPSLEFVADILTPCITQKSTHRSENPDPSRLNRRNHRFGGLVVPRKKPSENEAGTKTDHKYSPTAFKY